MSMPLKWKSSVSTTDRAMMKMTAFNGEFVRLFILAMNFGRQPPLAMVNMTKAMEFCWAMAVNTPYVGFGAIATLTQEAKDPKHGPSRAMMVMAVLLCVLYVNPKHRTKMGMSGNMLWMAMAAIRYTIAGLTRYCSSMSQPAMKPGIFPNTWLT